ncbi:nucleotidyltransferase domain-containing protein [Ligilactobacillus sp. WILCCON 0076]|uniref:Nucleotidyltransferase domain-containing protein n=1 Tax=Ligilactobacillus ubinensis TaxID=2876789 RepID=A0A9X2FK95_9LACO|nr:nucleotidyltransferase domain-containing protein [Ligilactobacillus ubinensis]MCP0886058.1 nucleotidyltransferase domain-containing protein [Ligilactobacillus ubinensis]
MKMELDQWKTIYLKKLTNLFGTRLVFVGLQGSYGREEATENSDIDMVVILDHVEPADLTAYDAMLDSLPYRDKMCGFISGVEELKNWERSDLFQFYYDTTPILGSIDFLKDKISTEDVRRAVRIGACNLYHMCGHNMVHEKSPEILKDLYKSAMFTVQAVSYLQTGTYQKSKMELLPVLQPLEHEILETAMKLKQQSNFAKDEFDRLSARLFQWTSRLIAEHPQKKAERYNGC